MGDVRLIHTEREEAHPKGPLPVAYEVQPLSHED